MNSPDSKHSQLWQQLVGRGWAVGDMPARADQPVWFIRALLGFAGWCASFFLLGFFLLAFGFVDSEFAILTVGVLVIAAAVFTFAKAGHTDFIRQAALACSLCGQLLVTFALAQILDGGIVEVALLIAVLQILLIVVVADFSHRLMCALFVAAALSAAVLDSGLNGVQIIVLAIVFVWIWRTDDRWGRHRALYEPVGVGLGVALLILATHLVSGAAVFWRVDALWGGWLALRGWLLPLAWTALTLWVVDDVLRAMDETLHSARSLWLLFVGVIVAIVSFAMPGAGVALLVLVTAYAKQRRIQFLLSALSFIWLAINYYYTLQTTLLNKSLLLMATGALLLIGYYIAGRMAGIPSSNTLATLRSPRAAQRWVVGLVALALVLMAGDIYKKERLLAKGAYVLLELAPVDPRAPMQGDYMRLRFAVANTVREALPEEKNAAGYLVLVVDANRVGRFDRLADTLPNLDSGTQIAIRYRIRNGVLRFATNAFFFQEGNASRYEDARFGEFRVGTDGEMILNALRDENHQSLGLSRP